MSKRIALFFLIFLGAAHNVFAAVGCDLNDPDRDVKRIFPESTGYRTEYKTLANKSELREAEARLGDNFSGLYETVDVPYTVYTILKGKEIIGYIHGINQKGKYGGLQAFLGYDTNGKIVNFYYQKLTSKKAGQLRSPEFAKQFVGNSFEDFKNYNPRTHKGVPRNVAQFDDEDFWATLRAVKKNFILTDIFIFSKAEAAK